MIYLVVALVVAFASAPTVFKHIIEGLGEESTSFGLAFVFTCIAGAVWPATVLFFLIVKYVGYVEMENSKKNFQNKEDVE